MTARSNAFKDNPGKLCYFITQYNIFRVTDLTLRGRRRDGAF